MNAGLTNLDTLKKHLLAKSIQASTDFDSVITAIGLGVAGRFDRFCNRNFAYLANATQIFTGNRPHYYLARYPLVSVALVEMRYFITDAWTDITGQPISWNPESGLIHFGYTLGREPLQVRVTWTGGYWYEQKEPADVGYPSTAPAPVLALDAGEQPKYALPPEVQLAFLLQCQEIWNKRDKLGSGIAQKPDAQVALASMGMIPDVCQALHPHIRYQLT